MILSGVILTSEKNDSNSGWFDHEKSQMELTP